MILNKQYSWFELGEYVEELFSIVGKVKNE